MMVYWTGKQEAIMEFAFSLGLVFISAGATGYTLGWAQLEAFNRA